LKEINHALNSHRVLLAVVLLIICGCFCTSVSGDVNDFMNLKAYIDCVVPLVVLEKGINDTSTIYVNSTSAKISINATSTQSTYNYSLNIVNNNASLWEVRLEHFDYANINRVNTTIILHNNSTSSEQITIKGGNIDQTNNYYNLASNEVIHVGVVDLVENSAVGTTILRVYLKIKTPNTTTYTRYIITFEFT